MINYLKDDIQKLEQKKKELTARINNRNKNETEKEVKALSDYQGIIDTSNFILLPITS